jgi:hypothetical protein
MGGPGTLREGILDDIQLEIVLKLFETLVFWISWRSSTLRLWGYFRYRRRYADSGLST